MSTQVNFQIQDCTDLLKDPSRCSDFAAHYLVFRHPHNILDTKKTKEITKAVASRHSEVKFVQSRISDPDTWINKMSGLLTEAVARELHENVCLENTSFFLAFGNKEKVVSKVQLLTGKK